MKWIYREIRLLTVDWQFINGKFVFGAVRFFVINKQAQLAEPYKPAHGRALFGIHIYRSAVKIEWLFKDVNPIN